MLLIAVPKRKQQLIAKRKMSKPITSFQREIRVTSIGFASLPSDG